MPAETSGLAELTGGHLFLEEVLSDDKVATSIFENLLDELAVVEDGRPAIECDDAAVLGPSGEKKCEAIGLVVLQVPHQ